MLFHIKIFKINIIKNNYFFFIQSLELLKAEVQKWRTKKEWYEAINEIHEKRDKIENEIAWAQVEDHEKVASEILTRKDNQKAAIDVVCISYLIKFCFGYLKVLKNLVRLKSACRNKKID